MTPSWTGAVAVQLGTHATLRESTRRALRFMLNFMNANADSFLQGLAVKAQNRVERADLVTAAREWPIRCALLGERFSAAALAALERLDPESDTRAGAMAAEAPFELSLEPQELGLVQHERLEESLAIESLATRAGATHRDALLAIARHIMRQTGKRHLDPLMLPLAPVALGRHFFAAVNESGVRPEARPAFVKLFARFVLDELGPFYAECLREVAPEPQEKAHEQAPAADDGWSLQDLPTIAVVEEEPDAPAPEMPEIAWDAARTPMLAAPGKAMALPRGLLDEMLLELQRDPVGLGRSQANLNPKAGVLPLEIYELVNAALTDMGQQKPMALTLDMIEAVNLVRLLFDRMLRDLRIAPPVRRLLRLLQIPLLRAALHDPEVLSSAEHPVRRFLSELVEAVIGWIPPPERANDAFFRSLQHAVGRIVTGYRADAGVFADTLGEFRVAVCSYQARARLLERHSLIAELGRLEREAARAAVSREITSLLGDAVLPRAAGDFLRGTLSDALFVIHLQHGVDSTQWRDAVQAIGGVVAVGAGRPGADFAAAVPGLLQALRSFGFDEVAAATELQGLEAVLGAALPH